MSFEQVRSVLVATDLSRGSEVVVQSAARLARHAGGRLAAIHALESSRPALRPALFELVRLQRKIHRSRQRLEDQVARTASIDRLETSCTISHRPAPRAILDHARATDAELIVMGPHRSWMPGSHLLGTTARRVMEGAAVPCLVTQQVVGLPLRRVLVALDEPDVGRGVLGAACQWLGSLHSPVDDDEVADPIDGSVLHVAASQFEWNLVSGMIEHEIEHIREMPHVDSRVRLFKRVLWGGSPATTILRCAEQVRADLVVLGMREHGSFLRALLGSVSSEVMRQTPTPVLVFPPRAVERWLHGGHAGSAHGMGSGARPMGSDRGSRSIDEGELVPV